MFFLQIIARSWIPRRCKLECLGLQDHGIVGVGLMVAGQHKKRGRSRVFLF